MKAIAPPAVHSTGDAEGKSEALRTLSKIPKWWRLLEIAIDFIIITFANPENIHESNSGAWEPRF
ncbi:hypothetical protein [Chroococcidiopsis sp. CCMEE 29]|uniref:hypothetical protein n=1 Tax=Chroococcidiopsis sp. CCMEE 29 TaxID=155894 RepID=UPI00202242B7|nr:hypothetical protein [Chroococcidiopsis sp. CCMEE 29]